MTDDKLPYCPVYKLTLCISRLLYLLKKSTTFIELFVEYLITADDPLKLASAVGIADVKSDANA